MKTGKPNGLVGLNGCIVRDSSGIAMAILEDYEGILIVKKTTACSIGTYLYIISVLRDMGFEVR